MSIKTLSAQFEGQSLDIYDIHGARWIRGSQIGYALGFAFPTQSIDRIHKRNAGEFGPDDTMIIDLPSGGGVQSTRMFSEKGVAKIAMLARSPKAAAFRDWAATALTTPPPPSPPVSTGEVPAYLRPILADLKRSWLKKGKNRKFLRYAKMGLTGPEIMLLCGWKAVYSISKKRREAEALGLLEPPANLAKMQQMMAERLHKKPARLPAPAALPAAQAGEG